MTAAFMPSHAPPHIIPCMSYSSWHNLVKARFDIVCLQDNGGGRIWRMGMSCICANVCEDWDEVARQTRTKLEMHLHLHVGSRRKARARQRTGQDEPGDETRCCLRTCGLRGSRKFCQIGGLVRDDLLTCTTYPPYLHIANSKNYKLTWHVPSTPSAADSQSLY
jgi:hypothetical protein